VELVARGVVVAAPAGVREGVVGVVDLLEFLRAAGAFGRVGGDAVGVVAEGLSMGVSSSSAGVCSGGGGWWVPVVDALLVGIADLLLGRFGVELERGVCRDVSNCID